jgi:outer membrane protein TolC
MIAFKSPLAAAVALLMLTPTRAYGQVVGAGQAGAAPTQATPLPLSGRAGQAGSVAATQTAVPGATTSVNTLSPTVQVQGALLGSVPAPRDTPFTGRLTLRDAVQRGLDHNLGPVNLEHILRQARSQQAVARSARLPTVTADFSATWQQLNLAALGFRFDPAVFPDLSIPTVVGPFGYSDLRARLAHSLVDVTASRNYRAAGEIVRASQLTADDARDLVVLAVGGTYLQAVAARARVDSARAQVETANTLNQQTIDRRNVGLVAQVDVNRSQIQALIQQQRLLSLQNDFAKQKINLARMIGLPPTDSYELADRIPFSAGSMADLSTAVQQARSGRADLQAATAQLRAAELALSAARAERLPTVSINADYGASGSLWSSVEGTFSVSGRVRVPIWDGGRIDGHVTQAATAVAQRRAELDDLSSQVEADVRKAMIDLETATAQVGLAQKNIDVTREALALTRQRFDAGIDDNAEVVRAQEAVAVAELDYINALFAHNVGKLNLARATGQASERLGEFLKLP